LHLRAKRVINGWCNKWGNAFIVEEPNSESCGAM
jgi:hypothetical protein